MADGEQAHHSARQFEDPNRVARGAASLSADSINGGTGNNLFRGGKTHLLDQQQRRGIKPVVCDDSGGAAHAADTALFDSEAEGDECVTGENQVALEEIGVKLSKTRNVKALLEKLSEFLTENNLEEQIEEERKDIHRKIESKNEEISQKRETHRHKLNKIHEAYKREIQEENERHLEDLKETETDISSLKHQLQELEQLNLAVTSKISCTKSNSSVSGIASDRVRELLECPVCLEEMRPPKKIFQCSNGHVICELCKNNPEVRSCPTCRLTFRGHIVRNIVAEKLARNTCDSDSEDSTPRPTHTRESNPVDFNPSGSSDLPILGFQPAYGYIEEDEEERDDDDIFIARARIASQALEGQRSPSVLNPHRRLNEQQMREYVVDRVERVDSPAREARGDMSTMSLLREAHRLRTNAPHPRYIPHHMRRQRTARDPTVVSREAIRDSRESRDNRDEEETDREEEEQALSFRLPRRAIFPNRYPILR